MLKGMSIVALIGKWVKGRVLIQLRGDHRDETPSVKALAVIRAGIY
jgi:hypothetical protein